MLMLKMIIDTGASINIIDENMFAHISKLTPILLKQTRTKLFAYGSKSEAHYSVPYSRRSRKLWLIIKLSACNELNLIQANINNVQVASKDKYENDPSQSPLKTKLDKKFPTPFHNLQVKLHIDPTVPPVPQQARRIPFHLRQKDSEALQQLENDDVIEKVEGPTPWISPLVVIPKSDGTVQLCVDM